MQSLEMLAFNLKLLSADRRMHILVSAGKQDDKRKLLPTLKRLKTLGVDLHTTPGTYTFLQEKGIDTTEIHKIASGKSPNILSSLKGNRFDLVINVLTGDIDYDEDSDAKIIRKLAIQNGIPLITDADVAIETIEQVLIDNERGTYRYKLADESEPWNLQLNFLSEVEARGGFRNHHAHFDKAYLVTAENLRLSQIDMEKKWDLYQHLKASSSYSHDGLVERISRGVEMMVRQGATYCRTMVDADSTVGLKPIDAALEVKRRYADKITFEVGIQPLQGVVEEGSREYYTEACRRADYCGGLPSRDRPQEEKHLDIILGLAKELGKPIDVHVDQENNPEQNETELLAIKTIEHGMQGKVFGVHAISVSAKPENEQDRIIEKILEADMGIIICPSAALSMKPLDKMAPLHNSIAPFERMRAAGVRCYLGVDNVHDLFMPMVDGDMWTECRLLMEACRFYDVAAVADLACATPVTASASSLATV